jgi:pimeloyl-ACP methyl ester carboxylesterase
VLPLSIGRNLVDLIADAELVVFDTGHTPFVTRPDELTRAVVPFLDNATREHVTDSANTP